MAVRFGAFNLEGKRIYAARVRHKALLIRVRV